MQKICTCFCLYTGRLHVVLAFLDRYSIQDRQFISIATIQDCYSILNRGAIFLMTADGDDPCIKVEMH